MPREVRFVPVLLACLLVCFTGSVETQTTHTLRYNPSPPTRIHQISRSEVLMTVSTGAQGPADILTVEAHRLESMTQYVDAGDAGRYLVELHYDSLRSRMRPVGGAWRELRAGEKETAVVRVLLDQQMRVLEAEFMDSPHLQASRAHMTRGLIGGITATLPEDPLTTGVPWSTEVAFPLSPLGSIGQEEGVPADGELRSLAQAVLDSAVTRGRETLYYMTIRGSFVPAEFTSTVGGQATIISAGGSMASMIIWSSTRNVIVSSATRAVVEMDVRDPGAPNSSSHVRFDVTTYTQVRM